MRSGEIKYLTKNRMILHLVVSFIFFALFIIGLIFTINKSNDIEIIIFYVYIFVDLTLGLMSAYYFMSITQDKRFKRLRDFVNDYNNDKLLRTLFQAYLNNDLQEFNRDNSQMKKYCYANIYKKGPLFTISISRKIGYLNVGIMANEMKYIFSKTKKEICKTTIDDHKLLDRDEFSQFSIENIIRKINELYEKLSSE